MLWEQRRESLCQRQRWHSGSRLHILWFSYLISKNTFFFPPALRSACYQVAFVHMLV